VAKYVSMPDGSLKELDPPKLAGLRKKIKNLLLNLSNRL
jgi:hypothetical protein